VPFSTGVERGIRGASTQGATVPSRMIGASELRDGVGEVRLPLKVEGNKAVSQRGEPCLDDSWAGIVGATQVPC
jgi:hypothetical protein